jgi:hypothetical protein
MCGGKYLVNKIGIEEYERKNGEPVKASRRA